MTSFQIILCLEHVVELLDMNDHGIAGVKGKNIIKSRASPVMMPREELPQAA